MYAIVATSYLVCNGSTRYSGSLLKDYILADVKVFYRKIFTNQGGNTGIVFTAPSLINFKDGAFLYLIGGVKIDRN